MLHSMSSLKANLPASVSIQHLCGHQDEYLPFDQLTVPEQLNAEVDAEAKDILSNAIQSNTNHFYSNTSLNQI